MGAMPLQRFIDEEIKRPLSRALLFGNLKDGGQVHIKYTDKIEVETTTNVTAE